MDKLLNVALTAFAVFCCLIVPVIGIGLMLWESWKQERERKKHPERRYPYV